MRKRGPLFLCFAFHARGRMAAPTALHESRGIFSFSKENIPLEPPRERKGSAPRPRHCERAARRAAVLAESDACLVLYLNDLTLFYLRCRFACVSTIFSNLRLLRIFIVLLLPAKAALLRSPHSKKRPHQRSFLSFVCASEEIVDGSSVEIGQFN